MNDHIAAGLREHPFGVLRFTYEEIEALRC